VYRDHAIGVVVRAYNEAGVVGEVIDTLPEYVDRAYVVDASTDDTCQEIQIHETIGFGAALLVAGWILLDAVGLERDRSGAVALGLAAASGTVFFLLVKLWHFRYGRLAITFFYTDCSNCVTL